MHMQSLFDTSLSAMCEKANKLIKVPARFATGRFSEPLHYLLWRINDGLYKAFSSASPMFMKVSCNTYVYMHAGLQLFPILVDEAS